MEMMQTREYREEVQNNQKIVRERILESVKDIETGKGREHNEFFDALEKRYTSA